MLQAAVLTLLVPPQRLGAWLATLPETAGVCPASVVTNQGPRERGTEHHVSNFNREVEPEWRTGLGGGRQHADFERLHRLLLKLAPLWMQAAACSV